VCSEADEGCPFIAGAEKRIPSFEDQKHLTTQHKSRKYKKSLQITLKCFIFSQITILCQQIIVCQYWKKS
jgi:arsenate reductase